MSPSWVHPYYYNTNQTTDQSAQSNYASYSRSKQYGNRQNNAATTPVQQNYSGYQQPQAAAATYMTDQTQQSYGQQNYYGNSRDSGQRAAETLSRLGTTGSSYPASTGTAYNQTQASNNYNSNYNSNANTQYSATLQNPTSTYTTQSSYATAQSQARPASVKSVRSAAQNVRSPVTEPMQQPRTAYQRTQQQAATVQRSASPAQIQASHQLQRLADQRAQETVQTQTSTNTFVDPSAVYDPWPEYQRKLAAARAAKETEDRAAAEREAEEKRLAEEEEARLAEEKAAQAAEEKERKKAEAARKRAEAKASGEAPKKRGPRKSKGGEQAAENPMMAQIAALSAAGGTDVEAQIRQLMAMVKSMNDKHPDLLAKIWDEERQSHLEGGEPVQPDAAPVAAPAQADAPADTPKKKKESKKDAAPAEAGSSKGPAKATGKVAASKKATAAPTATMVSAQPPATKKSGTIWPEEKKGKLAAAASAWLSRVPESASRPISASKISSMLDKNPTYIELCEMIEKCGLKVERAAFAKVLLNKVPDVNSKRPAASPTIPRPASIPNGTTPFAASASRPTSKAGAPAQASPSTAGMPTYGVPIYDSPYFDNQGEALPAANGTPKEKKEKKKKKATDKDEDTKSDRPSETPGPVTKADQARKRTFADLVDLTALSDDDMPPLKQSYYGPPQESDDPVPGSAYTGAPIDLPNFTAGGVVDPYLQQSANRFGAPSAPGYMPPERQANPLVTKLNAMELAKPLDRKFALRRSRYDIRTLARDVLLATGKHPDLLPLNGHLELLRSAFPNSINQQTDLSTVRWDLIDPGEPVPAMLDSMPSDDKDSVMGDADDESKEEHCNFAIQCQAERRFIVKRLPIPAGVGGQGAEPLNSPTTRGFGGERGKLVPSRGGGRGRGRGRPPGMARLSTGGAQTPIGNHTAAGSTPRTFNPAGVRQTPIGGQTAGTPLTATRASGGTGYSAFEREVRPDGTKKRGRPKGWRKAIHGRPEISGGTPRSGGAAASSYNGPPLPQPSFAVYNCEWKDCGAELENLKTLRKHVAKKHTKPDETGRLRCQWAGCGKVVQALDPETGALPTSHTLYNFPTTEAMTKHMEDYHITPIGFRLGDGPAGGLSESERSEPYLSDAQGRRVTPTIQPAAPSPAAAAARTPGQRGRPPKKNDEEKARESLAMLAKQKKEIGLGVDREGATFANEKRRAGFVDDEERDEVVERSD